MTDKEYQEDMEPNLGAGSGGGRSFRGPAADSGGEQDVDAPLPPYDEEKGEEGATKEYQTTGDEADTVVTPGPGDARDVEQK